MFTFSKKSCLPSLTFVVVFNMGNVVFFMRWNELPVSFIVCLHYLDMYYLIYLVVSFNQWYSYYYRYKYSFPSLSTSLSLPTQYTVIVY